MPVITPIIQPQGKVLQQLWDSNADVQIIRGPLGSGKTTLICNKILHLMTQQQPDSSGNRYSRWLCVRNSYSELHTTSINDWMETNGCYGEFNGGGAKPPHHKIHFALPDGTEVKAEMLFISFDIPKDVKKAKGLQLTGVWLNEMSQLPKSAIDMLSLRTGRYPSKRQGVFPTYSGMIGDTNSFDNDHWLFEIFNDRPEGWECMSQPGGIIKDKQGIWQVNNSAENLNNLREGYYKKGMQGKTDDWIKINLANEYGFVSDGKPVHPEYRDSVHCIDLPFKPLIQFPIILGFDWGRTPACSMMQQTPFGGYVVFDEFVSTNMSAALYAPALYKYLQSNYAHLEMVGWGDPSGGQKGQMTEMTVFKVMNKAGIPCKPTTASNDILERRSAVDMPLTQIGMDGLPRLIVLPKAKTIRKGLAGGFCFKRVMISGEARYHDQPDKNKYSHPVEALEYALVGVGEGRAAISTPFKSKYDNWDIPIN